MHDWQSLAHVRWECKYHVVIMPKFRRKILYGQLRKQVGRILRELCDQRGVELIEGKALADHVHLCQSIPPKYIAHTVGFLKGTHSRTVLEGQECGADPPQTLTGTPDDRTAFLVDGVLRQHGRGWMRVGSAPTFESRSNLRTGKGTWT